MLTLPYYIFFIKASILVGYKPSAPLSIFSSSVLFHLHLFSKPNTFHPYITPIHVRTVLHISNMNSKILSPVNNIKNLCIRLRGTFLNFRGSFTSWEQHISSNHSFPRISAFLGILTFIGIIHFLNIYSFTPGAIHFLLGTIPRIYSFPRNYSFPRI
jgi:hypothetical protein